MIRPGKSLPEHENWFECDGICPDPPRGHRYQTPLPEVKGAPVPSVANYNPQNLCWEFEFFGNLLGIDPRRLVLRYENNTPDIKTDDIFVQYPDPDVNQAENDNICMDKANACNFKKSKELKLYETYAKKSKLLKLYMDNSPAEITYFNQICPNP